MAQVYWFEAIEVKDLMGNWPIYRPEGAPEGLEAPVPMQTSIPLWKWHEGHCTVCGKRLKYRENILDSRVKKVLNPDDVCSCFRGGSMSRVSRCIVIWDEEVL